MQYSSLSSQMATEKFSIMYNLKLSSVTKLWKGRKKISISVTLLGPILDTPQVHATRAITLTFHYIHMYIHGQPLQHNQLCSAKVVFDYPITFIVAMKMATISWTFSTSHFLLLEGTSCYIAQLEGTHILPNSSSLMQGSPQLSHSFYYANFWRAVSFGSGELNPSLVALYYPCLGPFHYRNRVKSQLRSMRLYCYNIYNYIWTPEVEQHGQSAFIALQLTKLRGVPTTRGRCPPCQSGYRTAEDHK